MDALSVSRVTANSLAPSAKLPAADELGASIKAARVKAGLSQQELADRLDVHSVTVSNWERGATKPDEATLERIATQLRTTAQSLRYPNGRGPMQVREPEPSMPRQLQAMAKRFEAEALERGADDDDMAL